MATFQAKIGWKMMWKREHKNYHSIPFLFDVEKKTPKQIAKKLKKLKDTVIASFRAKLGWKRPRKSENKNDRSVSFLPDSKYKIWKR